VAVGLGYVWVANGGDDSVTRIDPITFEASGTPVTVGSGPSDIAIGFGSVWTTDYDGGTVSRINPAP
jgi:YVTN family beta-propeller protein